MTLVDRLANLEPHAQEQVVQESAADVSTGELIRVLVTLRLTSWGELFVINALLKRGPQIFDPVARALLDDPLGIGAPALGEVLVKLLDDDNIRDERVVPTLVQAAEIALDRKANTKDVSTYILLLRDCWNIVGPLPATASLVKRLHEVASTESDPYPFDDLTARWLEKPQSDPDEQN
jgi:hypothetical protein